MINPNKQPTFTGKFIDPFDMKVDDICIEDIAHHLSQFNRYNGATPYPYSVGQHSLLVADILLWVGATPKMELAGLLHDASEAYLGDVTTPIKQNPISEGYRAVEWHVQRLVEAVFELPYGLTEANIVKWADKEALQREWWALIEPNGRPTPRGVGPMTPHLIEAHFLDRFHTLECILNPMQHRGDKLDELTRLSQELPGGYR